MVQNKLFIVSLVPRLPCSIFAFQESLGMRLVYSQSLWLSQTPLHLYHSQLLLIMRHLYQRISRPKHHTKLQTPSNQERGVYVLHPHAMGLLL